MKEKAKKKKYLAIFSKAVGSHIVKKRKYISAFTYNQALMVAHTHPPAPDFVLTTVYVPVAIRPQPFVKCSNCGQSSSNPRCSDCRKKIINYDIVQIIDQSSEFYGRQGVVDSVELFPKIKVRLWIKDSIIPSHALIDITQLKRTRMRRIL